MLLAEAATQLALRREPQRPVSWRNTAYWVSIAANNFGDLDFLYARITSGRVGYLLHHRGHTHTVAAVLPIALLVLLGAWSWARFRGHQHARAGWSALMGLALIGPILHLLMDATNDYGVHPFWPFDSRWHYGDAVFIIEPFFWLAAVPPLFAAARTRSGKAALALILGFGVAAAWISGYVRVPNAVVLTALTPALLLFAPRVSPLLRVGLGLAGWSALTGFFLAAHARAESIASTALAKDFAPATVVDQVLTPFPGDPFCFRLIALQRDQDRLHARIGTLSSAPGLVDPRSCPAPIDQPTAQLSPIAPTASSGVAWRGERSASIAELRALAEESCHARAMLRFVRAPFWQPDREGRIVLGDLRYDREPGLGFAEMILPGADTPCPRYVPPWTFPRSELIEGVSPR